MNCRVLVMVALATLTLCATDVVAQDGKPDLSGWWMLLPEGQTPPSGRVPVGGNPGRQLTADADEVVERMIVRNGEFANLVGDINTFRRKSDNIPLYKPEYWDVVRDLDLKGNQLDPYVKCRPLNVPRLGAPTRIVQTPTDLVFMYQVAFTGDAFRIVPFGPRKRPVLRDGTWRGSPVARWDGETLVVEYEGFNTETWLGGPGWLHGYDLKVTERYRRKGNVLLYDVTVEDPEYLQQPWVMDTATYVETEPRDWDDYPPCEDRDSQHQVGRVREF